MALVRCEKHGPPNGTTYTYESEPARPVGYPGTALVCGLTACESAGLVWLTIEERKEYRAGQRVFSPPNTSAAKFRVE